MSDLRICTVIAFTASGLETAKRVRAAAQCNGWETSVFLKKKDYVLSETDRATVKALEGSLKDWTGERFGDSDAIIFVGATGIAVRSIAPFVQSKQKDPAVICVDEKGKFTISLLSGHIGGANELAQYIAEGIGSIPVVTTATDLNDRWAVDVFAKKNDLYISSMELAKEVSAQLLDKRTIGFVSELPVEGKMPEGLVSRKLRQESGLNGRSDAGTIGASDLTIRVSYTEAEEDTVQAGTLTLIPRMVTLGVGCRKDKDPEEMETFLLKVLKENHISIHAVREICSIDVKKDERAILAFSEKYGIPFRTFTAEELKRVSGTYATSSFVNSKVGVDNVCERSAVCGNSNADGSNADGSNADGSNASLIINKTAENGMTAAAAVSDRRIYFE